MSKLFKYYQILGVKDGAGLSDISSSYRRLCRVYHPDVSRDPGSEEKMKSINLAYSILRDNLARKVTPPQPAQARRENAAPGADTASEKEAFSALSGYFNAICRGDYERAYGLLSDYDRQYVTSQSFCMWRKSVARLYLMREFSIIDRARGAAVTLRSGKSLPARKFRVGVTEKNLVTDEMEQGEVTKLTVWENGQWRVFLGYSDLREIARVFDELFEEKRRSEIVKNWEEYYDDLCPGLGLLSVKGLGKETSRELYRQSRYGGELTFAGLYITIKKEMHDAVARELMRCAARSVMKAIRETDAAGYMGDGCFIVLLPQLGGESAPDITRRLAERVRREVSEETGEDVEVLYAYEQPAGEDMEIDKVFERLSKKR